MTAVLFPTTPAGLTPLVRAVLKAAGPGRAQEISLVTGTPRVGVAMPPAVARELATRPTVPFTGIPLSPPAAPVPGARPGRASKKSVPGSRRARRRTKE